MEFLWVIAGIGVLYLLNSVFVAFTASGRVKATEDQYDLQQEEIEELTGVIDVRREIRDSINDPDERQRLFDKYNKDENNT